MTIWIDNETGRMVNINAPYKGRSRLDTAEIRASVGVVEIQEDQPSQDVLDNPDNYTRREDWNATQRPYIVWDRKSDERIKQEHNNRVWQQIDAVERQNMFPRQLRDFMLEQPGASGKPWFAKIKAVDDEVVALKATLLP